MLDKEGKPSVSWQTLFIQLLQNLQQSLSNEGFVIPNVSSAANSVTPPVAGGQLAVIQATYGTQSGVQLGTLVFDPAEVNGSMTAIPNGQLKILLGDGTFHKVTNT
jgi:hypothetical protein